MAGKSAGITLNLTKEQIMQKIDDLDSRIHDNKKEGFNVNEQSAAYYLSSLGFVVFSQQESEELGQRRADTLVIAPDGEKYELEIKTLCPPNPPATANSVRDAIKSATKARKKQAAHLLIDGRAGRLTKDQADAAINSKLRDLRNSGVTSVRVLGADGFDKTYPIPSN